MRRLLFLMLLYLVWGHGISWSTNKVIEGRETLCINNGWSFILQDIQGAYRIDCDDLAWRTLSLPHDLAFENGYAVNGAQLQPGGYACGGIGWYRKKLNLSEIQCKDKRLFIHFNAVYMNSEVWINGHYLGKRPYGYISFEYEVTNYVKPGSNIISVRVDNSLEPSARWYHGCGIYGDVSLITTSSVRFSLWDTFIQTSNISAEKTDVEVSTCWDIAKSYEAPIEVEFEIRSPKGVKIEGNRYKCHLGNSSFVWRSTIEDPMRWDLNTPYLYTLVMRLWSGTMMLDEQEERFGIRSVEWKADTGFWLNGRNVKLRGVCEHLEGGPVGAAWTKNLMRWKIGLLKDMGCNAIRTAHNPQLPMFYDLCDEMGMLVMDEAFDGWKRKAPEDYGKQAFAEWWERDLRDFIRRDRNHPSVIIYSLGNETGGEVVKDLVRVCHEEDSTRLVTSGHSGSELMDVFGVNGHSEKKEFILNYHSRDKAFIGTETPHTWQVRGYYRTKTWYRDGYPNKKQDPFETPDLTEKELFTYEWASPEKWVNAKQHFNSSYDNAFVRINARQNIEFLRDLPWYSGSFRWTGFDYLGEAGYVHGGWPFKAFMGGVLDLAGFKKDHYFLYQSEWTTQPMVHILPHWTHPEIQKGTKIPVWVYTTGDEVELFLNHHSLGKKLKGTAWNEMQCEWMVPWEPGVLEAIAYKNGKEIARARQETSGIPSNLVLKADTSALMGLINDLHIISIYQKDSKGVTYPYGENRVYFHLEGPGEIFSVENGNPVDVETNYGATSRNAFFGLLRAFVKRTNKEPVKLCVASILGDKRLKTGRGISIDVKGLNLDGTNFNPQCEIYYTVDGTEPSRKTLRYTKAFKLEKETIVKALVIYQGREIIRMSEKFGPDEGLYWGEADLKLFKNADIQAEECLLTNAIIDKRIPKYQGKGYALLEGKDSGLEFYQENDGSDRLVDLILSMTVSKASIVSFRILNNGKQVGNKDVTFSNEKAGNWQQIRVPLSIYSGANQIKIEIRQGDNVSIDWIDIK